MSGLCPNCGEHIKSLANYQDTTVRFDVMLDGDWGTVECIKCGGEISEIKSEDDAVSFLKGEMDAVMQAKYDKLRGEEHEHD